MTDIMMGFEYYDGNENEWRTVIDHINNFNDKIIGETLNDSNCPDSYPWDTMIEAQKAKIKYFVFHGPDLGKLEGPLQITSFALFNVMYYKQNKQIMSLDDGFVAVFKVIPPCYREWIGMHRNSVKSVTEQLINKL